MISAILLAGGVGVRFGSTPPKQYTFVRGKPLILYSFEKLLGSALIDEIIVVCAEKYHTLFPSHPQIVFAPPGKTRQDSVFQGVKKSRGDLLVIHDGARPLFCLKAMEKAIEAAKKHGAAALALPVTSTIKHWNESLTTLDRTHLWEVQTPQVVNKELMIKGFYYVHKHNIPVTDDLSIVESIGHEPVLVKGNRENLKLTTPEDLKLLEAFL